MGLLDFFRRRETKASAAGAMIVQGRAGQAQWTQRNQDQYARDGYQQNPVVYRAVRLIAENAASLPLLAMIGEREVEAPAVLARPNPFIGPAALLEAVYSYRLLTGNAFVEAVRVGAKVAELHFHRPQRIKIVPGPDGYPAFYEFNINGQVKRFPVDGRSGVSEILHLKDFHPLDDWYGMSPLDAAAWAIDGHTAGSSEVATTLQKGGIPAGALFREGETPLTAEQGNQAREMIAERVTQARRDRMPMAMDGTLWKWVPMGQGPAQLGLVDLKADAAREICFALGVPPMLLGIPGDNTYSNYAEANRAFWRETVIPFARKNLAEIGQWLGALSGQPEMTLLPNTDDIPALAGERAEMWTMLNSAEFVTVNEKREAAGFKAVEGGDKVLVASSDIPLEDAGANLAGGEEPEEDPEDDDGSEPGDDSEGEDESAQDGGD